MAGTSLSKKQTFKSTLGSPADTFSGQFWRFIQEEVGIIYIYPEQKSYLKKEPTFDERQAKIDIMLEKVHYDDDKLDQIQDSLALVSEEAKELSLMIKKLGLMQDICCEAYILNYFLTLFLPRLKISQLDESIVQFKHLRVLNLSFNNLTELCYVPESLEELYLSGNQIRRVRIESGRQNNLIHLSLSYNQIGNEDLEEIACNFQNLFCLDVSFNDLTDFGQALRYV